MNVDDPKATYLGFDLSTQKLKAVQINSKLATLATAEVLYDSDLPEFRTTGGANAGPNKNEYTASPVMWLKAFDMVLDRLVMQGADLSTVMCISGSGQQHGSVYWSKRGIQTLKNLDPDKFLHLQLNESAFTVTQSPIWMDGSTEQQCLEMETAIGGRQLMIQLTGSKCYSRFTGPQIRKIYQTKNNAYEECERISLVSSFVASVFLGDVAPLDWSDASGMNLFDIKRKTWAKACLNACAPDLEQRLGEAVKTNTVVGKISDYFVKRFSFSAECRVAACTGDNPSALSGMLVAENWLVVSLGTSDTVLMNLKVPPELEEGHVLCHPTDPNEYMGLLCFRNGSLIRDNFKKSMAENNWNKFNELLDSTPRGNFGNMAVHFQVKEIIPNTIGTLRWSKEHNASSPDAQTGVEKFSSPQTEIRALIEGQFLHKRAVASDVGFSFGAKSKLIATGGASVNKAVVQVISDVFNAPVYVQDTGEAALMGAAYRAKYSLYLQTLEGKQSPAPSSTPTKNCCECHTNTAALSYHDYIVQYIPDHLTLNCTPSKDSESIYVPMLSRFRDMLRTLEASSKEN